MHRRQMKINVQLFEKPDGHSTDIKLANSSKVFNRIAETEILENFEKPCSVTSEFAPSSQRMNKI